MKNNNGKIAVAIVAMFVVALSVVGFTYAYFTASVQENAVSAESVKVTAGSMIVNYTGGQVLTAQNILPGWSNDGDKYYDINASNTVVDPATGKTGYVAASKAVVEEEAPFGGSMETAGLAEPVEFKIENTGDNTAAFDVQMKVLENYINSTDLTFVVYTSKTDNDAVASYGEASSATQLLAKGETHDLAMGVKLEAGKTMHYKIIFTYANNGEQNAHQTKSPAFQTKVEVTGLDQRSAQ